MSVDLVKVEDHSIICALKIVKVKRFTGKNLQNMEMFFEIHGGSKISALSDWQPSSQANRAIFLAGLENAHYAVSFCTTSGRTVGITGPDYQKWVDAYGKDKIHKVITRISSDSYRKSWLSDKGWYFQVSSLVKKELDAH